MEQYLALYMVVTGFIGLMLVVPLFVSAINEYRYPCPAFAWSVSGFVVVGRKARVGMLYGVQFQRTYC